MLKQFYIFTLLVLSTSSIAQEVATVTVDVNKRKGELVKLAKEAERTGEAYLALEYYKQLAVLDSSETKYLMRLADLYRHTRNYVEAEKYYQKVSDEDADGYPLALFYLGTSQKSNGKHKEAIENLNKFKKVARGGSVKDPRYRKLASTEIEGCDLALLLKDSLPNTVIGSLGDRVNNPHIDFNPISLSDDKIVYGSLREDKELVYDVGMIDSTAIPTRKFYVAEKNDKNWEFWGEWDGPFNSDDSDVGNGTFSVDGNRFYFTRCAKNWQYKTICKIYFSEKTDGVWTEPELMDNQINMEDYTSSHPTVGRESKNNQEVIYFVSDREGTRGGLDIWYAQYDAKKKKFREPKNCGSKVNSMGDDVTPYYDLKTQTLYFSTNGRANIGGLDIYKTEGERNKFLDPTNMGISVNSVADDLDYTLKPSGKGGYFVSNRLGGQTLYNPTCCDDIYEFIYLNYIELIYKGNVIDKDSLKCIDGEMNISVFIVNEEGEYLSETVDFDNCDYMLNLRPGFDYVIEAYKDGYFDGKVKISTKNALKSDTVKKDIVIEKMPEKPIVIQKLTYEFNSALLSQDSKNILDTTLVPLLERNPDIIIEIYAHTDNKGSDDYNLKLSQLRAESVVKYLTGKGFNKNRFKAVGYGETLPLVPNENPNGTDNPENRQINRRTEFKIAGKIDPNLLIDYDYEETDVQKSEDIKKKKKTTNTF